ncbi:uncharacterized protein LY89DRAFT_760226 [Mollisia scopiformis]|uniref:Uncharacterized protein n=1 Tax=Mollisia scopiformis TaxID=149040 RepID=A0A132BD95_MOLSC|nr:uncharacterized protein LY89DRAFT_760226 [Mollisia scopiformis]KUJ10400.1 hypothetical protein LY89DRAFT_760226 [Mollisia scopiformis]
MTDKNSSSCYRYMLWETDNPKDCEGQYIWLGPSPVPAWTPESFTGFGDWVLMTNCPSGRFLDCPENWKCDSDTELGQPSDTIPASTDFEIQEPVTITSLLAASEIHVVDIYTGVDGHLTTSSETRFVSGGISTMTTVVPLQLTAFGTPGGLICIVQNTSPISTGSLAPDQWSNQYLITTTISSTNFLGSPPTPTQTIADALSNPTRLFTTVTPETAPGSLSGVQSETIITLFNLAGILTGTSIIELDILTDSSGRPTATVTELSETPRKSNSLPIQTPTTALNISLVLPKTSPITSLETVINSNGMPIETLTVIFETPSNSSGAPAKTLEEFTATGAITAPSFPKETGGTMGNLSHISSPLLSIPIEPANYFVAMFVPVLMAAILSIFIQMVDKNLKLMLPFYALTRSGGAAVTDSLCLVPGGFAGSLHSIRLLFRNNEPISFLCDVLVLLTAVLISISSEAIGINLTGVCDLNSFKGCSMFFDVFDGPSRAVEYLMVIMVAVIICICILLYSMRSGVAFSPWSIASIASFLSEEMSELFQSLHLESRKGIEMKEMTSRLEERNYAFGFYFGSRGIIEYGIVLRPGKQHPPLPSSTSGPEGKIPKESSHCFPKRLIVEYGFRVLFLTTLCGLLTLIVYYDTVRLNAKTNSFERFIDSQKFGVRSFFVACGVIISFFWDDMFSRVGRMQPYKDLSHSPRRSNKAISASLRPTVFPGFWNAVRNRQVFTSIVAFASILSKITPIFLSNIPFRITQTWTTHKLCAWTTITILGFMILVLIWSFFVKDPQMPVDANTIAGHMYYLYDSSILKDFQGTWRLSEKEWKEHLKGIKKNYKHKNKVGSSGQPKIGIYRDGTLDG